MYNQAAGNHPKTCCSKKVFRLYANINIQFSVQCIIISILFRSSFILKMLCGECVPYLWGLFSVFFVTLALQVLILDGYEFPF